MVVDMVERGGCGRRGRGCRAGGGGVGMEMVIGL